MNEIVFSEVIKEKLQNENITQLASQLDIPKSLLHDWLMAKRLPSMKNMVHVKVLAEYLDLTLDEILFGKVKSKKKTLTNVVFNDAGNSYQVTISKIKGD